MAKLPAFQFYPGDWRKDMGVQSLSFHDRGVWWEMLCLMHESERRGVLVLNGTAMREDSLARLLGLDKQILTITLTTLLTTGVASREPDTGAIYSRRMVRDEHIRKVRAEAGIKGGNPILLNQIPTTGVKQIPTPSSSSSSLIQKDTPKAKPSTFTLPIWIPEETWIAFEETRKKIRAPLTDRARQNIVGQLVKLQKQGNDPDEVLNQSITRGWRGVFPFQGDGQAKTNPLAGMNFDNARPKQ